MNVNRQQGITLLEVLIAALLSSLILAASLSLFNSGQKDQQSVNYLTLHQAILNGFARLTRAPSRIGYDMIVLNGNSTNTVVMRGMNGVVFNSNDLAGDASFNQSAYMSSSKSGASTVDIPSDQLVIQYRVDDSKQRDCQGQPIVPFETSRQSVIERYLVAKQNNGKLELVCDAGRYSATTGFSGLGDNGSTVIPNVDYFRVNVVLRYSPTNIVSPNDTRLKVVNIADYASYPVKQGEFEYQVIGLQLGILYHLDRPSETTMPAEFRVLDQKVISNVPNGTVTQRSFNTLSQFVSFNEGYVVDGNF